MTSLTELDVSYNQLSNLPFQIGFLTELKSLNFSYNQLSNIPSTFIYLTELSVLNLAANRIEQSGDLLDPTSPPLPPFLSDEFNALFGEFIIKNHHHHEDNKVKEEEKEKKNEEEEEEEEEDLYIIKSDKIEMIENHDAIIHEYQGKGIEPIWFMSSIEDLDLSLNMLASLPPSAFRNFKRLSKLSLSYNMLTNDTLPILFTPPPPIIADDDHNNGDNESGDQKHGQHLLRSSVPSTIEALFLNGNRLQFVPIEQIRNLKLSLRKLSLDDNFITTIPPELFEFSLQQLILSIPLSFVDPSYVVHIPSSSSPPSLNNNNNNNSNVDDNNVIIISGDNNKDGDDKQVSSAHKNNSSSLKNSKNDEKKKKKAKKEQQQTSSSLSKPRSDVNHHHHHHHHHHQDTYFPDDINSLNIKRLLLGNYYRGDISTLGFTSPPPLNNNNNNNSNNNNSDSKKTSIQSCDLPLHPSFPSFSFSPEKIGDLEGHPFGYSVTKGVSSHPTEDTAVFRTFHFSYPKHTSPSTSPPSSSSSRSAKSAPRLQSTNRPSSPLSSSNDPPLSSHDEYEEVVVHMIGVFDGHGGNDVSLFLQSHLPPIIESKLSSLPSNPFYDDVNGQTFVIQSLFSAFDQTNHDLHSWLVSTHHRDDVTIGSTAVVLLLTHSMMYCINVGDSRAVLVSTSASPASIIPFPSHVIESPSSSSTSSSSSGAGRVFSDPTSYHKSRSISALNAHLSSKNNDNNHRHHNHHPSSADSTSSSERKKKKSVRVNEPLSSSSPITTGGGGSKSRPASSPNIQNKEVNPRSKKQNKNNNNDINGGDDDDHNRRNDGKSEESVTVDNDGHAITTTTSSTSHLLLPFLPPIHQFINAMKMMTCGDSNNNNNNNNGGDHHNQHSWSTLRLSVDHKPNLHVEAKMIRERKAFVMLEISGKGSRLGTASGPGLAVSRAFGDFYLNTPHNGYHGITNHPHYISLRVRDHLDHIVVMGSDGVWDVISDEHSAQFVMAMFQQLIGTIKDVNVLCCVVATKLRNLVVSMGSGDDIVVVIVPVGGFAEYLTKHSLKSFEAEGNQPTLPRQSSNPPPQPLPSSQTSSSLLQEGGNNNVKGKRKRSSSDKKKKTQRTHSKSSKEKKDRRLKQKGTI